MVYSTRRFVFSFALYYFVIVFFSPFSIAITSLWEKRANLSAFRFASVRSSRNVVENSIYRFLKEKIFNARYFFSSYFPF